MADIAEEGLGDFMTSKEHAEGLKAVFQTTLFEGKLGKAVSSAITYRTKEEKKTLITQGRDEINPLLNETVKSTHNKMVQVIQLRLLARLVVDLFFTTFFLYRRLSSWAPTFESVFTCRSLQGSPTRGPKVLFASYMF